MVEKPDKVDSPFMVREPVRLGFGTMMILLLMVVAAGVGLLVYYALRVPAITSEINAWLGRPDVAEDHAYGRRAQVTFALFTYTAPLALGILVSLLHFVLNWFDRLTRPHQAPGDDPFRME